MPTYDYICKVCSHEFEAFQKMSDSPLTECPVCKGEVKRKIGAGLAPVFKGSGFYITDYKKSGTAQSAETKSSPAASESTTPKSDSKTEGKTEKKAV